MSVATGEGEIALNKVNLALERSRRLLNSWLPPASDPSDRPRTDAEIEQEEAEIFKPMPELLGISATPAAEVDNGDFGRTELSSNEKLRQQLLGKDYKKYGEKEQSKVSRSLPAVVGSKPNPAPVKRKIIVQEESDEEGRSNLGKSKRKTRLTDIAKNGSEQSVDENEATNSSKPPKRAVNYLDEVLQAKANKKRKKNKSQTT